jgi:hypothetical protein
VKSDGYKTTFLTPDDRLLIMAPRISPARRVRSPLLAKPQIRSGARIYAPNAATSHFYILYMMMSSWASAADGDRKSGEACGYFQNHCRRTAFSLLMNPIANGASRLSWGWVPITSGVSAPW